MHGIRVLAFGVFVMAVPPSLASPEATERARKFVTAHESKMRSLDIASGEAWWTANITGKDEDFKKKEGPEQDRRGLRQGQVHRTQGHQGLKTKGRSTTESARPSTFSSDLLASRSIRLSKVSAKASAVEQKFNVFRQGGRPADRQLVAGPQEVHRVEPPQVVWEGSKLVGADVEADLKELVGLRNEMAKQLGFKNYHALMLFLSEQDGDELIKLFDDLDTLTREPFTKAKAEIDAKLAANVGVKVEELMPWHYHDPFFQESPAVFDANLDEPFAKADILQLCRTFYKGIGLPIDDVIARSDLYEKAGKSPHAFCTDIDREGDVRVLANIVPNEYWMGTMLHELGHSVTVRRTSQVRPLRPAGRVVHPDDGGVAMQLSGSRSRPGSDGVAVPSRPFDAAAERCARTSCSSSRGGAR